MICTDCLIEIHFQHMNSSYTQSVAIEHMMSCWIHKTSVEDPLGRTKYHSATSALQTVLPTVIPLSSSVANWQALVIRSPCGRHPMACWELSSINTISHFVCLPIPEMCQILDIMVCRTTRVVQDRQNSIICGDVWSVQGSFDRKSKL